MAMIINQSKNSPENTYTLSDFVEAGKGDQTTYENFSILHYNQKTTYAEQNIMDYYLKELKEQSIVIDTVTNEEIVRYRYKPDLLSYDVYGTTQLDWVILLCNGIIDPKEFDPSRKFRLPNKASLTEFLSAIYSSEKEWIDINRAELLGSKEEEV